MPKSAAKSKSLHIASRETNKGLDEVLSNGCATTVVILVGWCGACQRVKPMWLDALKKKNKKNLVLINNDVLPETSLNSLNITHFPSTFEIPPGGRPNLVENPQTMAEINAILNGSAPAAPALKGEEAENASGSEDSEEVNASQYVTMHHTPRNSIVSQNTERQNAERQNVERQNAVNAESMRTRSFTPSLEKLKGGRRKTKYKTKSKSKTKTKSKTKSNSKTKRTRKN